MSYPLNAADYLFLPSGKAWYLDKQYTPVNALRGNTSSVMSLKIRHTKGSTKKESK